MRQFCQKKPRFRDAVESTLPRQPDGQPISLRWRCVFSSEPTPVNHDSLLRLENTPYCTFVYHQPVSYVWEYHNQQTLVKFWLLGLFVGLRYSISTSGPFALNRKWYELASVGGLCAASFQFQNHHGENQNQIFQVLLICGCVDANPQVINICRHGVPCLYSSGWTTQYMTSCITTRVGEVLE